MSATRPALQALAGRLGILDGYRDVNGDHQRTPDATREALALAMGYDASDERAAVRSLEALDRRAREQVLAPVLVWREWADATPELQVNAQAVAGTRDYSLELRMEDGQSVTTRGRLPAPDPHGVLALALPLRPPYGYHEVCLCGTGPQGDWQASQRLVMAPRTVLQPEELLGDVRAFGLWTNLYSVRARGDWGHGGLRELASLGRLAGEVGAAFVGINPLHAVTNRGLEFSPYSPASRLYRNVLYIDPESIPELAYSPVRAQLEEPRLRERRAALEGRAQIDHEAVLDLMLPILRAIHAAFVRSATPERRKAYVAYCEREGAELRDLATWEAIAAWQSETEGPPGTAWEHWPESLRDPRSPAVEAFRVRHAGEVDFRSWLQFELDRQLEQTAEEIRAAGCELGIYQDLALGSSAASADTWMAPDLFAKAAHVGAPPDAYAPEGQNWGFPPFDPHRLRADGYRAWSRLLRAGFAHAGALRIDHAMGLSRLFWIPEGRPGTEGAYVGYRPDDLLGILALESRRSGALVVAEDLGTLPPELPGLLADWGLLRSAVVYFERDGERFRPTEHYPPRALASVSTHDLAPLAGHFIGTDLELRRTHGSPEQLDEAHEERARARRELVAALRAEGFLEPGEAEPDEPALRDAVHAFLSATPSVLVGVSLDDLAGEREPVNLPGIRLDEHRSWSRRMKHPLEELLASPEIRSALQPLRSRSLRPRESKAGLVEEPRPHVPSRSTSPGC